MATQDVKFIIAVEDAGAIRKLTETERALYDLQGTAKKTESTFSQLWKGFAVGQLAVDGIRKGFSALKDVIIDGIKGAIEEEQSQHRLTTAMELTGRAADGAVGNLMSFAQAQMAVTTYTHEEIESVMTLLAQLTKLDSEGIRKATKGAMGLASVLGMDLSSAAMMVTKAMEGNTQALARVGIRIDENIPKEEQAVAVLEKLIDLYPRATAELDTQAGQLKQVGNLWKEAWTEIGKGLENTLRLRDALALVRDGLKLANGATDEGTESFKEYATFVKAAGGIIRPMSFAQWEAKRATEEWNKQTREVIASLTDFSENVPEVDRSTLLVAFGFKKLELQTIQNNEAFKEFKDTLGDIVEMDIGEAVDKIFPTIGEVELPDFAKALIPPLPQMPAETRAWLDAQIAFAKEATSEVKDFYEGSHDYSAEFYQDITRGFTSAFMKFKLTTQGFADFFISTWQAVKQAFFQILADMLARWLTMAFVKGIFSLLTGGLGGGLFGAGSAGSIGFAKGFEGVISQPTPILVGEAGPEYVSVRPMSRPGGGGGGGTTNINVSIYAYDNSDMERAVRQRVVPILKEVYAHGGL